MTESINEKVEEIYESANNIDKKFDFQRDKAIDVNNLHTENTLHSELCFKYNERRAKLTLIVNQLEELKKQTRSKLINDCIADPNLCDPKAGKYTDKKAETYYRLHPEYKAVVDALLEASYQLESISGQQRIMEDRKWQLKDLAVLAMSQYFQSTETMQSRDVYAPDEVTAMAMGSVDKPAPKENNSLPEKEYDTTKTPTENKNQKEDNEKPKDTTGTSDSTETKRSRRKRR